ncbi:tRNA (adenosine(37)-N6)-dimethylallyltransferase MiaA [Calidifontibacter sp. DB0510]|uniref:tRNA dimethylallyltransferase n=1 Tax=Metallococcus carri TaxID=1656884 RepID=A0A967B0K7_9MICO|nr:tRNA (adenosine(37)-N6)-dimethylallyltransferase MiaA [Metallococcus carri]NHN56093.1 tRNA (adenosine(37)-N6)-dimethylallyltransferase MiaA [Metallococcus carri]NOP37450.1 tRNA (adenosine(37)-N6)-dimethylallyltransferase MiaA [Calidifontibacter sp. DB2511S]
MPSHPIVAVVGATATGKSDLALELAEALDGEIVNADASQLYRGMDIGTAKLKPKQRRGIPHHQLDVLDVTQEASVAAYQRDSRADLTAIRERGRVPILVGGSGLYLRAALDVLEIPPTDPAVRGRLEQELDERGSQALHARLEQQDPQAAAAILPTNGRRIVRALEVIELTGRPFSATMPRREYAEPTVTIGLTADPAALDQRIAARTEQMWRDGLLDEVKSLVPQGLRAGRTASRAIGYQQALQQLDGDFTEREAIEQTTAATRRLVRRQGSWFRPDPRIHWLPAGAADLRELALAIVRQEQRQ